VAELIMRRVFITDDDDSDGHTPKEQIQQILAVAPVLPRSMMGKQAPSQSQQSTSSQHHSSSSHASHALASSSSSIRSSSTSSGPRHVAHTMPIKQKTNLHDVAGLKVQRQDSITDELDEFVDASSKD
jgi:hypothetical protein